MITSLLYSILKRFRESKNGLTEEECKKETKEYENSIES
jgi:hypothetical protein